MSTPGAIGYAEFAVQSNFSFLRGASKPEELAVTAALQGYRAFGLADRNSVAGVVRAWKQAEFAGLEFHPGARLVFRDDTPDMLAYPRDRAGWGHLCRMLTLANERGEKGNPILKREDLFSFGDDMSLAILPDLARPADEILSFLHATRDRFKHAVWLAHAPLYGGNDRFRLEQAAALSRAASIPLMAVNDVRYHAPYRRQTLDVVTSIRRNIPLSEVGLELTTNAERHLKQPEEMARLFRRHPEVIAETLRFAETLKFSLKELRHHYPAEDEVDPQGQLEKLTWQGADLRYPQGYSDKLRKAINYELDLIRELSYAPYFLTVYDIVQFARGKGILCQGRGSAANSTVCFCLHITEVDPAVSNLLFERFISTERDEPPDIDVDFEHERRDEVMAYIYEKYGMEHTALAAAVTTYRGRSAIREVAKAFGLSQDAQSALSSSIWGKAMSQLGEREAKAGGLDQADPITVNVLKHANELLEFPRHLTQHVGGFIITQDRLDEIAPIIRTGMEERRMIEWDKSDIDAVGLLKVDILALGMLSCLRRCLDFLEAHYSHHWNRRLTLADLHREQQPAVYDMICRADTAGVFQIESRAQMSMLPRLRPREFYDLVIEVAIVRPGPIQGEMVHPYLRRREKKEKPTYPKPELAEILERTLGVPLFQEQAMQIAIVAGGFTPGEADQLRRAMATFQRTGTIGNYETRMVEGMVARGYEREFAQQCFNQIKGFGHYGFPESHAASFALLVYASSWFKAYYPDVFCAAILNSQPMGFYGPGQLVRDAREHGIDMREADVNLSQWDCTLEEAAFDPARLAPRHASMKGTIRSCHAVRLGFRIIKGLAEADMKVLVEMRGHGYASVRDVWLRTGLSPSIVERLAEADAFRSIGLDRRAALWEARALKEERKAERLPLFDRPDFDPQAHEPATKLPVMPLGEHVIRDYRAQTLSLKAHPVRFLRERLDRERVTPNGQLSSISNGRRVSVVGLVLIRQRPGSARGVVFITLEDETGTANIIVWPQTFERFRPVVLGARLVRVSGKLQCASNVTHVVADQIEDISDRLQELSEAANQVDFRAPVDETKRPVNEDRRIKPPVRRDLFDLEPAAQNERVDSVMPRGRNFH